MKAKNYLPTRMSKIKCILLIGLLFCVYFLNTPFIVALIGGQVFTYLFKPILWIGISLIVLSFPRVRPKGMVRLQRSLNWWAFIFAFIFIVVLVMAGLLDGLGRSPYSHSLTGIMLNMLAVSTALVGRELIRSFIVNSLTKKENYLVFTLVALLMTLIDFPLNRYTGIGGYQDLIQFVAQYFGPEFVKNIFASYLVFLGGPITSIIYLGVLQAFHWLSPILPNLKWIINALVGILTPLFSLMAIQYIYATESKKIKNKDQEHESPIGWMATIVTSIGIVWFAVGVFPIYPSVIATGSMEPMIKPGDVILVKRVVGAEELKVGQVIQFRRDDILISHRIIEVVEEKGLKSYRTKGDNNSHPDYDLVKPAQIKGEIIKVVPKVGWPTLLIKIDDDIPLNEIQF